MSPPALSCSDLDQTEIPVRKGAGGGRAGRPKRDREGKGRRSSGRGSLWIQAARSRSGLAALLNCGSLMAHQRPPRPRAQILGDVLGALRRASNELDDGDPMKAAFSVASEKVASTLGREHRPPLELVPDPPRLRRRAVSSMPPPGSQPVDEDSPARLPLSPFD